MRLMLRLLLLGALGVALWRALESRRAATKGWEGTVPPPWVPAPLEPASVGVAAARVPAGVGARVPGTSVARSADPVDGACPPGFPVKGKLGSGIYHVPGGLSYERTVPDRCYASAADAEHDGLRAAKL